MISSSGVYGVKMQWTPEHAQWAEQHFDITSTTRSPAHKAEGYRMQRVGGTMTTSMATAAAAAASTYQYSWANDDISALTASNLLKKYAEKYSGILEMPLITGAYPDAAVLANGRKVESDPWAEPGGGVYSLGCEVGAPAGKVGMAVTSDVSAGGALCSSPGMGSVASLAEQSFSSSSCGSQSLASQETYPSSAAAAAAAAYGSAYLHPSSGGYSSHPSPLLQAPAPLPPSASHPTLVPVAYSATSSPPGLTGYSYTSAYSTHPHHQTASVTPGYSSPPPPPPPLPSSYLPAGIAAPTPLPPSATMPSYSSYPPHSLAPITPTPLNGCGSGSLKRKAFYMVGQAEMIEPYGDFSYAQPPSSSSSLSPLYRLPENPNGTFKPANQTSPSDDPRGGDFGGGSLTSPGYVGASKTPHSAAGESSFSFGSPATTTNGSPTAASSSSSSSAAEERLKAVNPRVLELVSSQVLQQHPLLDWGDIAGLESAKAALKEDILWPLLRPDMFGSLSAPSPLPRALLLFGPPGSGRSLLARCMSSQMGAPLLQLSCTALTTEWAAEAEQVVQACFLLARARQPCVVLLSEVEALLGSHHLHEEAQSASSTVGRIRRELQAQLDRLILGGTGGTEDAQVLLLATTSCPGELDEAAVHRYFARRVLVPPPDGPSRRQIISQNLAPHNCCLSEEEVGLLVQRTEGYSALGLTRLCQEALRGSAGGMELPLSAMLPSQIRPVTYQDLDSAVRRTQPDVSHKDMDAYVEWGKMFGCRQ